MVGVPVSDATQWDQMERVADCAYPVFEQLKHVAAQGEVIYQDDTHVRILALMAENRQAPAAKGRTGMHTTALIATQATHTICRHCSRDSEFDMDRPGDRFYTTGLTFFSRRPTYGWTGCIRTRPHRGDC